MSAHLMRGRHRAFVLIDATPGKEKDILKKLLEYYEVTEAHILTGQYDLIVVLEIKLYGREVFATITNVVVEKIRKLKDVRDTRTIFPTYSMIKH